MAEDQAENIFESFKGSFPGEELNALSGLVQGLVQSGTIAPPSPEVLAALQATSEPGATPFPADSLPAEEESVQVEDQASSQEVEPDQGQTKAESLEDESSSQALQEPHQARSGEGASSEGGVVAEPSLEAASEDAQEEKETKRLSSPADLDEATLTEASESASDSYVEPAQTDSPLDSALAEVLGDASGSGEEADKSPTSFESHAELPHESLSDSEVPSGEEDDIDAIINDIEKKVVKKTQMLLKEKQEARKKTQLQTAATPQDPIASMLESEPQATQTQDQETEPASISSEEEVLQEAENPAQETQEADQEVDSSIDDLLQGALSDAEDQAASSEQMSDPFSGVAEPSESVGLSESMDESQAGLEPSVESLLEQDVQPEAVSEYNPDLKSYEKIEELHEDELVDAMDELLGDIAAELRENGHEVPKTLAKVVGTRKFTRDLPEGKKPPTKAVKEAIAQARGTAPVKSKKTGTLSPEAETPTKPQPEASGEEIPEQAPPPEATVQEEPVQEESARKEPVQEESARKESVQEEFEQDKKVTERIEASDAETPEDRFSEKIDEAIDFSEANTMMVSRAEMDKAAQNLVGVGEQAPYKIMVGVLGFVLLASSLFLGLWFYFVTGTF